MTSTLTLIKNNSFLYLPAKFAYSIFIGVAGTIILIAAFNSFMNLFIIEKHLPWIIGLNCAVTGYSLLDKTKDLLKYKQISSIIAGVLNVLITYFILTLIYIFLLGESLFGGYDL